MIGTLSITNPETYIETILLFTLLVGVFQVLLGLFKLGFLANLISNPVISGFTSGAAIIIILSQLKNLVGIKVPIGSTHFQSMIHVFKHISVTVCDYIVSLYTTSCMRGLAVHTHG